MKLKIIFSYLSTKTYVVGTRKNCLNETVLLSTQNTCLNFYFPKVFLSETMISLIQFDTIMLLLCSLTLTMLNPNIPGVVNSVDSDQLASRPSDQDPHRFPFCS